MTSTRSRLRDTLAEGLRYCVCVTFNVNFSQKFDRRSVVVLEAERRYWKQLSVEYMSDESDGDDSNTFIIHPLSWRSES